MYSLTASNKESKDTGHVVDDQDFSVFGHDGHEPLAIIPNLEPAVFALNPNFDTHCVFRTQNQTLSMTARTFGDRKAFLD